MVMRKQDELLWAASWLHRASNNFTYMSYVQSNGALLGAGDDDYSFSWDDKRIGAKILLSKVLSVMIFFIILTEWLRNHSNSRTFNLVLMKSLVFHKGLLEE